MYSNNILLSLILLETTFLSTNAVQTPAEKAIELYETAVKSNEVLLEKEKEKIAGLVDPYERKETQLHPSHTLVKYVQLPVGIEILIIVFAPVIVAATLRYIMTKYFQLQCPKKSYQDDSRRGIFFEQSPQLPLYYLQQTKLEGKVKRESRQTLSWYSKTWVLKTNNLIEEVGGFSMYSNKRDPDQKIYLLKENRWKIIQTAVRLGGLYRQFLKRRNQRKGFSKQIKVIPKNKKSVLLKRMSNMPTPTAPYESENNSITKMDNEDRVHISLLSLPTVSNV